MKKPVLYALLIVIAIAVGGKLLLLPLNEGLWWDEAVYIGLGKSITEGRYSLDPAHLIETFRPPAFPFFIAVLSSSVLAIRVFVVIVSILAVFSLYALAKQLSNRETALWAALFLATNFLFVFFTTKALTEALFILFFSLSLLFFVQWQEHKKKQAALLSGVCAGLTFLTRYLGAVVIAAYLLFFLYRLIIKREGSGWRGMVLVILAFLATLIPWFAMNFACFGGIVTAFLVNFSITTGTAPTPALVSAVDFFSVLHIVSVFMILGICVLLKQRKLHQFQVPVLILLLSVLVFFTLPYREPRYLLSFLPVYSLLGAAGVMLIMNRLKQARPLFALAVIAVCLFVAIAAFSAVFTDRFAAHALVQASEEVKGMTDADAVILSASYPYGYAVAERKTVPFCTHPDTYEKDSLCLQALQENNWDAQLSLMEENNIRYVLVYVFEPETPENAQEFFDRSQEFERIAAFAQWGNPEAAVVYRKLL